MVQARQTVVIVPARGNSNGIPGKNLRQVGGVSLVGWSIVAGRRIEGIRDLVVSTDDLRIAEEAREWGASVIIRPVELASDTTATEPVMAHVLAQITDVKDSDIVVLLQPTSPLRRRTTVDAAVRAVRDEGYVSALTVRPVHDFAWVPRGDFAERTYRKRLRRQDMRLEFAETGSVYVTTVSAFRESADRVSGRTKLIVVDTWEMIDIDGQADLEVVDALSSGWPAAERPTLRSAVVPE